jgi:hypothetical protein
MGESKPAQPLRLAIDQNLASEQALKFIFRSARFANQRPQGSFGQLPVIWHRQPAHLRMAQNDVAPRLMVHSVA